MTFSQTLKDSFRAHIESIIKREGLTYGELAFSIGISRQALYNILKGSSYPSLELVDNLCKAYGLDELMFMNKKTNMVRSEV